MSEYEFEFTSNNYDVAISGVFYYSVYQNEVYIDDFDYTIDSDVTLDNEELSVIENEVQEYIQNVEIDTDYEEYDTTFEKYM